MKKIIAYIGTWTCYYIGDFFSKLIEFDMFSFLYSTYRAFMNWSLQIQDWGKLEKPWKEPSSHEEPEKDFES